MRLYLLRSKILLATSTKSGRSFMDIKRPCPLVSLQIFVPGPHILSPDQKRKETTLLLGILVLDLVPA